MHEKLTSLPWFLSMVAIAFVTGIAAALTTLVWIAPEVVYDSSIVSLTAPSNRDIARSVGVDSSFVQATEQKIMDVYTQDAFEKGLYVSEYKVGSVVLLSSNGWSAMYVPKYRPGVEEGWKGIHFDGDFRDVEQTVYDVNSGILYIKWSGGGFRVTSLPTTNAYLDQYVWVVHNQQWQQDIVRTVAPPEDTHPITDVLFPLALDQEEVSVGSFLFDSRGVFLGFVGSDNTIVDYAFVQYALPKLLAGDELLYASLSVDGRFVSGYVQDEIFVERTGFFVTADAVRTDLKPGDIIMSFQGGSIDPYTFGWKLQEGDEATFGVLRDGEVVDVSISL